MRLIDADANIVTMKKCAANPENEQALLCYRFAQRILEEAPTVDAVSCEGCTHKGKWENEYENGYSSPCTKCKRRALDNWERTSIEPSKENKNAD